MRLGSVGHNSLGRPRDSLLPGPPSSPVMRRRFGAMRTWHDNARSLVRMTSSGRSAADSTEYDVREHYTKYEHRVPMRDGVRLFTSVLVPKNTSTTYPILLTRTPFGISPYGVDEQGAVSLQSEALLRAGYIFVRQDVRGRLMSEGSFTHVTPHQPEKRTPTDVDEQSDTWDTVDWLLRHVPNHNGRVGLFGISYGGFFTAAGMIDTHPTVRARARTPVSPTASSLGRGCMGAGRPPTAGTWEASISRRTPQRSTASTSWCRSSNSISRTRVTRGCPRHTSSKPARTPGDNI